MDPATLFAIITMHDGTMHIKQVPHESAAVCQQAVESLSKRGVLAWCRTQWSTVIAR
jgi:hypothetical protein